MKNRFSLRAVFCDATHVNDCVKINHCIGDAKQYYAAAFAQTRCVCLKREDELGSLTPTDKKVTI
ncbi:hypothetical protein AGJ34_00980 [Cronobacter dublinensis subsp. dublinensis]|nr:hypothetical protein [Cronobacter dublinensis subsp. dublinensis]EGT5669152.1 hypothetical protein [Cronobacter dublinensis subsp. dublinensis]EGT5671603.1 hypothetical protein [Cronobacter dublinensis subsp. dublinensis]EGT5675880.1 hypothetical protein [Cronobacter dublinensis subsp. dublinensis]EGT5684606.1 hypothetical protein [Cronobacter dublinensis subsp. dublinensis]